MKLPDRVEIVEVGPRDGLQNVRESVSTEEKVRLVDALSETGVSAIEVTSFVHPRLVPQMADAEEVVRRIRRQPGVSYAGLVPNEKGAQRAIDSGVDVVNAVVSASETHNQENVRMSVADSLEQLARVAAMAREAGLPMHTDIATSFGCPFEGKVAPERVIEAGRRLRDAGVSQLALADTTGMANPRQVADLVRRFRQEVPGVEVAVHFHNTRGAGPANVLAALQEGVEVVASSIGGLGGCPFAPGATGNVCTEDIVHMLEEMGVNTGVDLQKLLGAARMLQEILGRELPGQVLKAGPSYQLHGRSR
jgi:hydroxymethylglutaryl-CoA lyase